MQISVHFTKRYKTYTKEKNRYLYYKGEPPK